MTPVSSHPVTFIPGDGVGPELSEATRRVLEATGRQRLPQRDAVIEKLQAG